jgi:hypothetical protein
MQDPANELRRIRLPRTPVNRANSVVTRTLESGIGIRYRLPFMADRPEHTTDPRARKDPTLDTMMGLLGIGLVCAAVALAVSDPPEIRNLGSKASIKDYVDLASFALLETFLVGMALVLLSVSIRGLSTKVSETGVRQLRPVLFRRVWIPYGAVTALREKGGCLWVESS